jgi:hypothetical protein
MGPGGLIFCTVMEAWKAFFTGCASKGYSSSNVQGQYARVPLRVQRNIYPHSYMASWCVEEVHSLFYINNTYNFFV